jgi:U6 snRNA-associated Sm-like protein LSm6
MENGATQGEGKDPSSFLSEIIGSRVIVKLNNSLVFKGLLLFQIAAARELTHFIGELQSVDGYMNIALEKCEEWVNGKKKTHHGDAFVRGNNGKDFLPCSF